MSNANETQVGGNHYRQSGIQLQHWDLAIRYQWDPFQYQITKYVMRWKHKHATHEERVKDLQKAAHFLQKYLEVAKAYDSAAASAWQVEGYFGDMTQHYRCPHCREMVRATSAAEATALHGDCAQPHGYVNQD